MACTTAANMQGTLNVGATPLPFSFNQALGGYEANNTGVGAAYPVAMPPVTGDVTTGDWRNGLDAALTGLPVKNSDVLVVRSTSANAQSVYVSAIADGTPQFTVNTQGPLANNGLAVISDCAKGVVFQITGIAPRALIRSCSITPARAGSNSTSAFAIVFFRRLAGDARGYPRVLHRPGRRWRWRAIRL